ncbi:MAG: nucleoside triphosphate pyrophosphohydrolase [Acidobacteriota bacterium]|nr:nucleoside triphosphate pyrophosphohydrolase [Acidobacteriota bacterium]
MTKGIEPREKTPTQPVGECFERLVDIMRTLRSPDGCAWDREQTLASLRPFILEEAYEVVDAIDRDDRTALRDELGDLLLEAVFVAQICADAGEFSIVDATTAVIEKLIRRHPHVFGEDGGSRPTLSPTEVKEQWERIKTEERAGTPEPATLLDGIPEALPSLLRAARIGARTATVGFDWDTAEQVMEKAEEEMDELQQAMTAGDAAHIEEELGDLLFTLANLARKLKVEPESVLRTANSKFTRRFRAVEHRLAEQSITVHDASPDALERQWQAVKQAERDGV